MRHDQVNHAIALRTLRFAPLLDPLRFYRLKRVEKTPRELQSFWRTVSGESGILMSGMPNDHVNIARIALDPASFRASLCVSNHSRFL